MIGAPRIEPFGDSAVLVTIGEAIDAGLSRRARAIARAVEERRRGDPRIGRAVAAYASVLLPYDAAAMTIGEALALASDIAGGARAGDAPRSARLVEIPVRYGGSDGPDIESIAAARGIAQDDVVAIHSGTEYEAYFLGFAPGFAYLGRVAAEIAAPRLASPRQRVPAGSVGIAGEQTGVYPADLPGGWQIIGRTDVAMWDLGRPSPALIEPGDRIRFVPVGR